MNKLCVAFLFVWMTVSVTAQTPVSGPQDGAAYVPAINVAVFGTEETEADVYFADAERNERKGDLNEALALFGKAAFEYNSDKQLAKYASSLLRMSNVHLLLAHYAEAEQMVLNVVLKAYSKLGNKAGQMNSYGQLGKIYLAAGKYTQSIWFYTQQGILAQQLKSFNANIESIIGIAAVKTKKGEYALALKDLKKAESLARQSRVSQFNEQIKKQQALIVQKQAVKK